ncbi:Origin recognition complex subunit [Meyerozyma sp. JA9]|nr:Origin recognition complex subunit [Meyerozyma sp. JA9]
MSGGEDDAHKTYYSIKRRKTEAPAACFPKSFSKSFIPLFFGEESEENVRKRHQLYESIWSQQRRRMENIVSSAYDGLLTSLQSYIAEPLLGDQKLPVAFASLGTNSANNLRILNELSQRLESGTTTHSRVITLNSKNSANIKSALREINRQLLAQKKNDDNDESDTMFGDKEGRIAHDFEIARDWCLDYMNQEGVSDVATTKLRLVVIIQDADSLNTQVLNQIINVLHIYSSSIPVKLVLGLSSNKVRDWINTTISASLRLAIKGTKFKSQDNKQLAYRILESLFLDPGNENPLLLDSRLAAVILNRFERANNSLDSLMSEIKLCYMIHFYQSPLSVLTDPDFVPSSQYISSLRKLPSFKLHIEHLVKQFQEKQQDNKTVIEDLLDSDESLNSLLDTSRKELQDYHKQLIQAVKLVQTCHLFVSQKHSNLHWYKVLSGGDILNYVSYKELLTHLGSLSEYDAGALQAKLSSCVEFKGEVSGLSSASDLRDSINNYIKKHGFERSLHSRTFYEVWTLSGGFSERDLIDSPHVEENLENVMLRLLRPKLRRSLEEALDNPAMYLGDNKKDEGSPIATHLFNVYRDAPVSINVYDFYCAFKQSVPRDSLLQALKSQLYESQAKNDELFNAIDVIENNEEAWEKASFSWFLHTCHEFVLIGLLKERSKVDFFEKGFWIGL